MDPDPSSTVKVCNYNSTKTGKNRFDYCSILIHDNLKTLSRI